MAGDSEVIKEFLVALGFKIDESGLKKFFGAVDGVGKEIFKLGTGIVAAMVAADVFVSKLAEGMDKLYFSSKRTGSSVQEINDFQYAISRLGGSSEGALSALEGLADFRQKFGTAADGLLISFGVKPEDIGDSVKEADDLARHWQQMAKEGPAGLANARAQSDSLNFDPGTFKAMIDPEYFNEKAKREDQNRRIGVDQQGVAKASDQFMEQALQAGNAWHLVAMELEGALLPLVTLFRELSEWIASKIPHVLKDIKHSAPFTVANIIFMAHELKERDAERKRAAAINGSKETPLGNSIAEHNFNPGNIIPGKFATAHGATDSNKGFAVFPDLQTGLSAMADNLISYGHEHRDTIEKIVDSWASTSPEIDKQNYKKSLSELLNTGTNSQLDINNLQTLEKLMRGISDFESGHKGGIDQTLIDNAAQQRLNGNRADNTVTIHQTNNIAATAPAGSSPEVVARVNATAVTHQTAELVRYANGRSLV